MEAVIVSLNAAYQVRESRRWWRERLLAILLTLGRKTALERLATFLLMLARRAAHRGEPTNPLRLCMTRTDIADCLGLTDETVSRTFGQLAKRGLIRLLNRHEMRLLNRDALEQIAEGAAEPTPAAPSAASRRANSDRRNSPRSSGC